jgi:hypothetical protein
MAGDTAEGVVGVAVGNFSVDRVVSPAGELGAAVWHRVRLPRVEHRHLDPIVAGTGRDCFAGWVGEGDGHDHDEGRVGHSGGHAGETSRPNWSVPRR